VLKEGDDLGDRSLLGVGVDSVDRHGQALHEQLAVGAAAPRVMTDARRPGWVVGVTQ